MNLLGSSGRHFSRRWLLRAAGLACFLVSGIAAFGVVRYIDRPPDIVLEPPVFDFGEVEHNQQLNAEFTIRNNGRINCTLSHFTPSCGCMTVSIRRDDTFEPISNTYVLPPGGEVKIVTGMTGGTMQGELIGSVGFETSSSAFPRLELVMKAQLFGRAHAIPASLDLGRVPRGTKQSGHFILTDGGRKPPFVPGRITSTIPSAIVTSREVDPTTAGVGGRPLLEIAIELPGDVTGGVRGEVEIYSYDDDTTPALKVPFVGEVLARWKVSPPAVVFPRRGAADPRTIDVQFQDHAGRPKPFVLCADVIPDWLHVDRDESDESTLRLSVASQPIGSPVNTRIRLRPTDSDDPQEVIEFPVHCLPDLVRSEAEKSSSTESP